MFNLTLLNEIVCDGKLVFSIMYRNQIIILALLFVKRAYTHNMYTNGIKKTNGLISLLYFRDLLKQIAKMLISLHGMDHAYALSEKYGFKI